jgi:predicted nucleic acid-binding protein
LANVIFDTNIYIFHSFKYKDAVEAWDKYVTENNTILISTIQISELLSFHLIDQQPSLKTQREKYISLADEVILIDDVIARKAAELRRAWKMHTGKALKLPDALIAATAIVYDAVLISNNDRDFNYIRENHELKYMNPIQDQAHLMNFIHEQLNK